MKIKDENKMPDLSKRLKKIAKKDVEVGVFGNEMSVVAASNELGAKIRVTNKMRNFMAANGFPIKKSTKFLTIPERSFIRSSFDNKKNISDSITFAKDIYKIDENIDKLLNGIGVKMADVIKKKIASNIKPENHPFTKKMKNGKSKTLINTSHLLNSVKHKIV